MFVEVRFYTFPQKTLETSHKDRNSHYRVCVCERESLGPLLNFPPDGQDEDISFKSLLSLSRLSDSHFIRGTLCHRNPFSFRRGVCQLCHLTPAALSHQHTHTLSINIHSINRDSVWHLTGPTELLQDMTLSQPARLH